MPIFVVFRLALVLAGVGGLAYAASVAWALPVVATSISVQGAELWNIVFHIDNTLGLYINGTIGALFALALLGLAWAVVRIVWNHAFLASTRRRFPRITADASAAQVETLLKRLGLGGLGRWTLVAQRIRNLHRLRAQRSIDVGVLREITGERINLMGGFARFLAGTLTVLGLIGTVLGLTLAVRNLSPLVSKVETMQQISVFSGQMLKTLGAMETAFSCTLTGLLCAFVLSLANYLVSYMQLRFYGQLEEFSNHQLVPALVPPSGDYVFGQFVTQLEELGKSFHAGVDRIDAVTQRYEQGATAIKAASGQVTAVTEQIPQLFEPIKSGLIGAADAFKNVGITLSEVKQATMRTADLFAQHSNQLDLVTQALTPLATACKAMEGFPNALEATLNAALSPALAPLLSAGAAIEKFPIGLKATLDSALSQAVTETGARHAAMATTLLSDAKAYFDKLETQFADRENNYATLLIGVQASVDKLFAGALDSRQREIVAELRSLNANISRIASGETVHVASAPDARAVGRSQSTWWSRRRERDDESVEMRSRTEPGFSNDGAAAERQIPRLAGLSSANESPAGARSVAHDSVLSPTLGPRASEAPPRL